MQQKPIYRRKVERYFENNSRKFAHIDMNLPRESADSTRKLKMHKFESNRDGYRGSINVVEKILLLFASVFLSASIMLVGAIWFPWNLAKTLGPILAFLGLLFLILFIISYLRSRSN